MTRSASTMVSRSPPTGSANWARSADRGGSGAGPAKLHRWKSISSTAPTSSSASSSGSRPGPPTTGPRSVRPVVCVLSVLGMLDRRRDPPRGGHRPRHRVVPQRPLAGLQDRGRHRSGAAGRSSACSRRRSTRWVWCVWPMVELEADDALASAAAGGRRTTRRSSRWSSAPRTRTSPSASSATGWSSSTGATGTVTDEAGVWEKFGVGPALDP